MTPRAVLFDFDGVLADTENVHVAAWERAFARMGWDVPPEVCRRAAEIDDRQFLREVLASRGIMDGDIEGWTRYKQDQTIEILRDGGRVYPGVARLVGRLRGRAVMAVVSGTWRANVETVLHSAGLHRNVALVVAKEDVLDPKPHPSAYRLAVETLRIRPGEAIALEDSPTGLDSARVAGIPVVAIGHRRPQGSWTGEAPYLPDLRDTDAVLRALGFGAG